MITRIHWRGSRSPSPLYELRTVTDASRWACSTRPRSRSCRLPCIRPVGRPACTARIDRPHCDCTASGRSRAKVCAFTALGRASGCDRPDRLHRLRSRMARNGRMAQKALSTARADRRRRFRRPRREGRPRGSPCSSGCRDPAAPHRPAEARSSGWARTFSTARMRSGRLGWPRRRCRCPVRLKPL